MKMTPPPKLYLAQMLTFVATTLACLTTPVHAQNNGQLMPNPSFEHNYKHWSKHKLSGGGQFAVDHKIVAQGRSSARIKVSKRGRLQMSCGFPVKPDQTYRIIFAYRTAKNPTGPRASTSFRPSMNSASGRKLCYVGSPTLVRTQGRWRRAVFYVKAHPNAATCRIEFNVRNGQKLWLDAFNVRAAKPGPDDRVYALQPEIHDPVFKELLTDKEMPYKVFPDWTYIAVHSSFPRSAIKFGFQFVLKQFYREMSQHNFSETVAGSRGKKWAKKYNVPVRGRLYDHSIIQKSRKEVMHAHNPPMMLPEVQKMMDAHVNDMMNQWGKQFWGLFYVGELYGDANAYLNRQKDKATKRINQQVRQQYGGGKYGLPSSRKANDEPYRWIAYRRWADDQYVNIFSSIQAMVKKRNPHVLLMGPNEINMAAPRDWERMAKTWDITSGQGHAAWNPVQKNAVGFVTKLMRDLSFKPTMPFPQTSTYVYASTPKFAQEQYSQVIRNGGIGFWINGVEWKDRELNHPRYEAPRRWQAMLALADRVRSMPRIKLPDADTGLFYGVDTYRARRATAKMAPEASSTYTFLGPEIGSWFDFFSEYQVQRKSRDLSDYNVIYIPAARYLDRDVVESLIQYVRQGGKLVCLDPTAFQSTPLGEDLTDLKRELLGVEVGDRIEPLRMIATNSARGLHLPVGIYPVFSASRAMKSVDKANTQTLMRFNNRKPAAVLHRLGKGRTLTLAYNPAKSSSIDLEIWRDFFRAIQKWSGSRMDLPIWHFQLPLNLPPRKMDPAKGLVCLTHNNVRMVNSVVTTPRNAKTEGGYRYSDGAPDEEGSQADSDKVIPFDKGLLTNRIAAYRSIRTHAFWHDKGKSKMGTKQKDWAISWPGSKKKPLTIDFKFDKPQSLRVVRLVVSGQMPKATLLVPDQAAGGSSNFKPVGEIPSVTPGKDVKRVGTKVQAKARVLRIRFAPTTSSKDAMVISEVELWGKRN